MASPRQPLGELSANVLFGSPGATPLATPLHTPMQGTARTPASASCTSSAARMRLWRQRNPERSQEQNAVGARVASNGAAFADFTALVADDAFLEKLRAAKADPKGPAAREVLKRVIGFINLSAKAVPWGTRERAAEMTKYIADHRQEGAGSIFYSCAPDDVHNPYSIRYSFPYAGRG